jgi:dTMP kinase
MSHPAGRFIVVEGPDGAGKSTLIKTLAERIRQAGQHPVLVREPGGTEVAEALRKELLDRTRVFEPLTELLYITAARADLIHHVIRPALVTGKTVLSDRFDLSTFAYQVAGRGVERDIAVALNRAATGGLEPDLTLVLDIPANLGMTRQVRSGKRQDRLDLEAPEFQDRVVSAYLAAAGPTVRHLDGTLDRDQVAGLAWRFLVERWPDISRLEPASLASPPANEP